MSMSDEVLARVESALDDAHAALADEHEGAFRVAVMRLWVASEDLARKVANS